METTGDYRGCRLIIGYILELYRNNGKENGNCRDSRVYIYIYWGNLRVIVGAICP